MIKQILQIVPSFQSVEDGVPLSVPQYGQSRNRNNSEQIIGIALVEFSDASTGIEWVTWRPDSRTIRITNEYFDRDCMANYGGYSR